MNALLALALAAGRIAFGECETHEYSVHLRAGETLRGAVEQDGVDVAITITRVADDVVVWKRNRAASPGGRERFLVLAARDGEYRLALQADERRGFYEIHADPVRSTTQDDLLESAGEAAITARRGGDVFFGVTLQQIRDKLEPALLACRTARAIECEADVMMELAHARWFAAEDVRGARDLLLASLPLREQSPDRFSEGDTYNDLGVISRWLGDLEEARDFFERVPPLKRLTTIENDPLVMLTAGPVYWQLGDLQRAIDVENAALAHWQKPEHFDHQGQAYVHNILGQFALHLGDTDEALAHAREARHLYGLTRHITGLVEATTRLGAVYEARGDRERALRTYREALRSAETIHDRQGQATALVHLGRTLTAIGQRDEARTALERAQQILREAKGDETLALLALGGAAQNDTAALLAFREVVAMTARNGNTAARAEAELAIARIQRRRGQLEDALQSLAAAQSIVESLRVRIANPEVRASYLAARQKLYDLNIDVLMRLGREADALDVSESGRARALLDSLQIAKVRDKSADPELIAREETVRRRLDGKASALTRITAAARDGSEGAALRAEIDALVAQHQQLRGELARGVGAENASPLRAREIQRLLDRDTLILEYALGESSSYLWVIGRDSLRGFKLPPRGTIESTARRVVELIAKSHLRESATQTQLAMRKLSDVVLAPAGPLLKGKRLAIVADGALQFVSFAALNDPANPSQPLVVDHEIVSLSSASFLAVQRPAGGAAHVVAVLADPALGAPDAASTRATVAFGPGALGRLPHTREEARRIAALVPAHDRFLAIDDEASRATAMSGALDDYRIVHFATHGFIHSQHPELSGLVLSDGLLRLADIYSLQLSADLVVLSACRTALGKDLHREGLVGLTRGFMTAGAPRVIASLWDVRDSATAELMERLYKNMLRKRMSPAAALRAAQVSMWRDPRYQAPFYWAAFVIFGTSGSNPP